MSTLVQIGDIHAAPGPRNPDRYRVLDTIIADGMQRQDLGAWLVPGDLNHGRMTIEDRNALAARLQQMASAAPVLIVPGNHDQPGDLDIFARLKAPHPIYVVDRPGCLRVRLASLDFATVFCLPYPTKAGLAALGVAKGDVGQVAGQILQDIFLQAAGELAAAAAGGDLTFMIGHVNVAGSMTSVGQPNIGHEIEVGPAQLDRLGDIYKGLNHIHKGQTIAGAWYPGSVCRLSWGEIEPKRYLLVHCTRADASEVSGPRPWTYTVEERPLDVPPMYHVSGTLSREGFTWTVTAGPGGDTQPPPDSWRGCEVRVRYTFPQSERNVLLHAHVQAAFAEALRLEVEPVAVPDRQLRAPAVALARTLAGRVAAFAGVETLAPSLTLKLEALEHGDPLQVLGDVQRRLTALVDEDADRQAAVRETEGGCVSTSWS